MCEAHLFFFFFRTVRENSGLKVIHKKWIQGIDTTMAACLTNAIAFQLPASPMHPWSKSFSRNETAAFKVMDRENHNKSDLIGKEHADPSMPNSCE